jgi:acyl-CoA reductase-like NAD-dependent aldehyde dehydrogenase
MKMFINGQWVNSPQMASIYSPYSGEEIDTAPMATPGQVDQALAAAEKGAVIMRNLSAYERTQILMRAADLLDARAEDIAQTISAEVGKPIAESAGAAVRCAELMRLSAYVGAQQRGETLPLDSAQGATGKIGFTLRIPCGVVAAITPYNYPLLLVMHKVAPALASGNAVILKPASQTPFTALKLTEILLEAGLPELGIQCITGSGSRIGPALCADNRVRKISFTGSTEVGEEITKVAGVKRLSLELGSNCPMVVLPDGDIELAAEVAAVAGYVNSGQVCISLQRLIVHREVYGDFLDALKPAVEAIKVGDPKAEDTKLGAMISVKEANRVASWIDEAVQDGARIVTGGEHEGTVFQPTIVADVKPEMRISCDELFGPAVAVTPVDTVDEALALSNDSDYGLAMGVFTRDISKAMRFARDAETGNVHINWSPLWRADFMPYGGLKGSGYGKEGPQYVIDSMTEIKTVIIHGIDD